MSTHNICFHGEIGKICGYPLLSVAVDPTAGSEMDTIKFWC